MIVPWLCATFMGDPGVVQIQVWVLQYENCLKVFDTKQDALQWFKKRFPKVDKRTVAVWML